MIQYIPIPSLSRLPPFLCGSRINVHVVYVLKHDPLHFNSRSANALRPVETAASHP